MVVDIYRHMQSVFITTIVVSSVPVLEEVCSSQYSKIWSFFSAVVHTAYNWNSIAIINAIIFKRMLKPTTSLSQHMKIHIYLFRYCQRKDRLKPPLKLLDTMHSSSFIIPPLRLIKYRNRFPMFDIWLKPVVTAIVVNDCLKHSRLLSPSIKYTDMVY